MRRRSDGRPADRAVVERHAPVVLGHPVAVRQVDVVAEHAMARLVVHLAGRALDRVEDDVLVVARRPCPPGSSTRFGCAGSSSLARDGVLPRGDLVEPLDADDAERCRELVQSVVEPWLRVVGLAVVAEPVGELDQLRRAGETSMPPSPVEIVFVAANDQMPGVAPGAGAPTVPRRAVRVRAVLEQRRSPRVRQNAAICSTSNAMWPPMWTRNDRARLVLVRLALEVVERHAEVVAVAVDELDAARRQPGSRAAWP